MSYNPAEGFPRIMPSLRYEDVGRALGWLSPAFGFKEHLRWVDKNGAVVHAEMRIANAFIELSAGPEGYQNPKRLGGGVSVARCVCRRCGQPLPKGAGSRRQHHHHTPGQALGTAPVRRPRIQKDTAGSSPNIFGMSLPLSGAPTDGVTGHALSAGRRPAAVLDLPGVVEDVPGDAADGVARRPALPTDERRSRGGV